MLFSGRAYPALADEIAELIGVELVPTRALNYANSEIYVRFEESVRGSDAFVIQSHAAPVNEWVMEQLIMVDALKRASAKRITVVAPFYPYARQDKKHRGREPISARLIADLFRTAGANRLMSVDLHAAQIQGFFDGPVDHLWALPVLADYVVAKYETPEMTVVSPDAGRVRLADMWTDRLNCRLAIIHKRRDPDVAQPGRGARGGRRGRGPGLPAGRRHDRHGRHHLPGRRGSDGIGGRSRSSPRRPTRCCRGRPWSGCRSRRSKR